MSNRAVSATYRTIIDDVIANVRQDFEDMGIEKEVLDELQRSWEAKIVATGVADFEGAAPVTAPRRRGQKATSKDENGKASALGVSIKAEDGESGPSAAAESSAAAGASNSKKVSRTNGTSDVHGTVNPAAISGSQASLNGGGATSSSVSTSRTTDGEADNPGAKRKRPSNDDDEIGSDLDDSDDDEMEGNIDADGNEDMILCLYDKVQRVRTKWKCVLKDGVASIDGRDYVFSKLSSELEW